MENKNFKQRLNAIHQECVDEIVRLVKDAGGRVYFEFKWDVKPKCVLPDYIEYDDGEEELLVYREVYKLEVDEKDDSLLIYVDGEEEPRNYDEFFYYDIFSIYDALVEHLKN